MIFSRYPVHLFPHPPATAAIVDIALSWTIVVPEFNKLRDNYIEFYMY